MKHLAFSKHFQRDNQNVKNLLKNTFVSAKLLDLSTDANITLHNNKFSVGFYLAGAVLVEMWSFSANVECYWKVAVFVKKCRLVQIVYESCTSGISCLQLKLDTEDRRKHNLT